VIVISIDGLCPQAITAAPAQNLLGMLHDGTHCPEGTTIALSQTLPAHASMITGLDSPGHGVTWNEFRPGALGRESIFTWAAHAGFSTAMLFSKDKFYYLNRPGAVHWLYGPARPQGGKGSPPVRARELADAFEATWPRHLFRLTFVHLGEPDAAGHRYGWMSEPYLSAVASADEAVGRILETIRRSGKGPRTAVIVTSDHGGSGTTHCGGPRTSDERTIPWICVGPQVPAGGTIRRVVRVYDTAPTVLAFLGLKVPGDLEGQPVSEVLP
jgi:arylsulfatase A-like enzyme